ncbi:MAG: DUF1223 domain-containing protein [Betaproteobacteria bacterium]|nr:DUF1223 domain-containing protein [Betaproteobacteria bacterium]
MLAFFRKLTFLAIGAAVALPAVGAQCAARSGPQTAVLVELYTSEGCDSCPPADRWLSGLQAQGYTPQVLLQGQDFRRWDTRDFAAAVEKLNSQPPRAKLALAVESMGRTSVEVTLSAELLEAAARKDAAVYLAAFENKLTSQVASGENKGRTLPHDYVVREWIGPVEFGPALKVDEKRTLPLLPKADPKQSGVAAFVQNRSTGEVLQALMLPACAG